MARLRRFLGRSAAVRLRRHRREAGIGHARRQPLHHGQPLRALHLVPARDLRKRSSAAEAEFGPGIDHADCDTRRFFAHCGSVKWFARLRKRPRYSPVPALMIGLLRARRFSSVGAVAVSGCRGGASSAIGARADITRSGGNVTMTSVPIRSFDFSVKVPPCMSIRLFAIGRPRPAPCSADLIELEPWPNEASTIGISSSAMPEPLSLTLRYCPPEAVQPTLSQISPPCGVNLIELDNKLSTTWRVARSSPQILGMPCSNTSWMVMPRLDARSFNRWWESATTCTSDTASSFSS